MPIMGAYCTHIDPADGAMGETKMIDVQKLWGLPTPANTLTIAVRRICGHVERYPFEGIEADGGYRMPRSEAERLAEMKLEVCVECDGDRD